MKTKQAFLFIMLILLSVADLGTAFDTFPVRAGSCEGRRTYIDVFTQKPRYNGEGQGQPSDMFGPQDLVVLYALVRINAEPVAGKLVSYEITGPQGTADLKFYRVAGTNASGISETLFSLHVINQMAAFGIWTVVARIDVAGQQYTDTLTFEVNWLIELISARTLDGNLTERSTFGLEGYVGVEITVRNNAWTPKTTRLGVTLFDEVNVPINSFEITNLTIPPDGKDWHIYGKLYIPKFGAPGQAWITVVALDGSGTAYCPEISTVFSITILNPIQVNFIDGAVFLDVWPMKAEPGEVIAIVMVVRNEGTVTLNDLNVTLTVDGLPPVSRLISSLGPYAFSSFLENWDTSGMSEGNFTIRAELQTFPHEADTSDNTYTATVELERKPVCTHDIQVTSVISSTYEACQGQTVDIRVAVRNNGNSTEATNVRAYYDAHLIYGQSIWELAPESEQVLIFHWNTIGVPEGIYQVSATATPVEGETNTADNTYVDGLIIIKICPQTVQDVAVIALSASPNDTIAGTPVTITAKVKNLGSLTESFVLKFFYDSEQIGESYASNLIPGEERNRVITWNTTGMPEGIYIIKAYIPPLPDETNTANNLYIDGTVLIRTTHPPTANHDVAVIAVGASTHQAYVGDSIEITVVAANLGDFLETFNVTLYSEMHQIGVSNSLYLGSNSSITLNFTWNTSGLSAGNYTLWSFADYVQGETNTANNLLVDGVVTLITLSPPDHYVHDVAVIAVQPERSSVFVGETVAVSVRVKNYGNAPESFNVTLYYDSAQIQNRTIYSLTPSAEQTLLFEWNTSGVAIGNYTLKAHAEPVPEETNLENNWLVDGIVEVKERLPLVIRDIAVTWLSPNTTEALTGENVTIQTTVINLGNTPETFNLTIYYDSSLIQAILVESLAPGSSRTVNTLWATRNVEPGTYVLKANVTILEDEANVENNFLEDGQVSVRPYYEVPLLWLLVPFLVGLALIALLLLLLLLKKKRKKRPAATPSYFILSHPHI